MPKNGTPDMRLVADNPFLSQILPEYLLEGFYDTIEDDEQIREQVLMVIDSMGDSEPLATLVEYLEDMTLLKVKNPTVEILEEMGEDSVPQSMNFYVLHGNGFGALICTYQPADTTEEFGIMN